MMGDGKNRPSVDTIETAASRHGTGPPSMMQYSTTVRSLRLWKGKAPKLKRLAGGATNIKYLITNAGKRYVARFLGEEQEKALGITRLHEVPNAMLAHRRGIGPRVIAHYSQHRLLLVVYVPGRALRKRTIRHPGNLQAVVRLLRQLHHGKGFRGEFDVRKSIRCFENIIERDGRRLPLGPEGRRKLARCLRIVAKGRLISVPCHIDPMPQNFIRSPEGLRLIDWEYSAMGDPLFDLAFVSAVGRFGKIINEQFLHWYFDRVSEELRERFYAMRALVYYREALWSLVQSRRSRLPFDYRCYAEKNIRWYMHEHVQPISSHSAQRRESLHLIRPAQ
jgi:thiamine kinase-like enzyme